MKRKLLIGLFFCMIFKIQAQKIDNVGIASTESVVNLASEKEGRIFTPPLSQIYNLKITGPKKSNVEIVFINFPQAAKNAFEYAVSIWESHLNSVVPVKILAKWESLDDELISEGRPSAFFMNFENAPLPHVYYPVALAEKLSGEALNSVNPDIICSFNKNTPWYFGLDGNTPLTHYDFVTSVLHEIAHGLGFYGFFKDDGTNGYLDNSSNLPAIYDWHIFNAEKQQLGDISVFHRPSTELHEQLTSGQLLFLKAENRNGSNGSNQRIYSPPVWKEGASIYHLETENGLMYPFAIKGRAIHNPGMEVIDMLGEMGWESVSFDFEALKDFEEPRAELSVESSIEADWEIKDPILSVIFSFDKFETCDSVMLVFKKEKKLFSGNIPLGFQTGSIQYYLKLTEKRGREFKLPSLAPAKLFTLRIGPDYIPPVLAHNPIKIIDENQSEIQITALAADNVGIKKVEVEYFLNGIFQEPVILVSKEQDLYFGKIEIPKNLLNENTFEYRIIAEDESVNGNKRYLPSEGFYTANVFSPNRPRLSYSTGFENAAGDFVNAGFFISEVAGFQGSILHTMHPYPVSALENEKYSLISRLKYPVILRENGEMSFDEIVLVEPGDPETHYHDDFFWDFVIIEGSSDAGKSWHPFIPGYDSGTHEEWASGFLTTLVNNKSQITGREDMFKRRTIHLTENDYFLPGDTVLFRFRLVSGKSVNGWGWAINNLEIQTNLPPSGEQTMLEEFNIYPNPFNQEVHIDLLNFENNEHVDILVTNLLGKTVYRQEEIDLSDGTVITVKIPTVGRGIYLLNITRGQKVIYTRKLVKK